MGAYLCCCCCCCCDNDVSVGQGSRAHFNPADWSTSRGGTGGADGGIRTVSADWASQAFRTQWESDSSIHTGGDGMCVCANCGMRIDSALIDGHREMCLLNQHKADRKEVRRPLPQHEDVSAAEGHTEEEICIVCLERLRCYAFLPCGHISCCGQCAKQLDSCPLCRQVRHGLCYVPVDLLSRYQCKHCSEFIAPTLFDGHREVCGLRMRQAEREKEERQRLAAASLGARPEGGGQGPEEPVKPTTVPVAAMEPTFPTTPPTTTSKDTTLPIQSPPLGPHKPKQRILTVCVECSLTDPHLVICLPCGHRVMCAACAKKRSTCPVCLSEIKHALNTYE